MPQSLQLASTTIDNIIQWIQGHATLDCSRWSPELLKNLDQEQQNKYYKNFLELGAICEIGQLQQYGSDIYFIALHYTASHYFLSIKINNDHQICHIFFTINNALTHQAEPIPEHLIDKVDQQYIDINITKDLTIQACIASAKKQTPQALVVFIQGSGPSNKDENVQYCRPFFDLAMGLAKNNIASIRFDKRTWCYPFISVETPFDEVIDDAISAAHLIRQTFNSPHIPLIILGHSQGATFVTQVAEQLAEPPTGFILLAAPSSNELHRRIIDQLNYLIKKNPTAKESYLQLKKDVEVSQDNWTRYKKNPTETVPLIFNQSTSYLGYLESFDPVERIQESHIASLILQGRDDYKVLAQQDFLDWQKGLKQNKNVVFKLYNHLEHCFVDSKRTESNTFSEVSPEVIQDISHWILARKQLSSF